MNPFYTRSLSAIVFVVVMLIGLLWNELSFFLLFLIVSVGCLQEYFRLIARMDPDYCLASSWHRPCVTLLVCLITLLGVGNRLQFIHLSASFIALYGGLLIIILLFIEEILFTEQFRFKNMWYSLLGLLYIGIPFAMMVNLRVAHSPARLAVIPLGLICGIWINDTMAYLVGSWIGKTKFFPAISPKKTWEGTIGGVLLTLVAGGIYGYFSPYYRLGDWLVVAAIAAMAGTAGDLLESRLKRKAGVKDSGNVLPGHGGFLDRFDSMIAAIPLLWLYVVFFLP